MAITRWDPFQNVVPLRDVMARLFEESIVPQGGLVGGFAAIAMDVYADDDNYVIEIAVPGLSPDAVNVSALKNQVTISGEFPAAPEGRQYLFRERAGGRFERTLTLPTDVDADKAQAHYEHGLLRLTMPKAESTKPRRIALAAGK